MYCAPTYTRNKDHPTMDEVNKGGIGRFWNEVNLSQ